MQPFAREEQRAVLGADGIPMLDEATGQPLVQSVAAPVKVARYKPNRYPLVLRWLLYYALAGMILFCGAFGKSAFIYQNF